MDTGIHGIYFVGLGFTMFKGSVDVFFKRDPWDSPYFMDRGVHGIALVWLALCCACGVGCRGFRAGDV